MSVKANPFNTKANQVNETPIIVPLPQSVQGVAQPVISLNGTWKLHVNPPPEFWSEDVDPASWDDSPVPGYTPCQGYKIEQNHEYAFRTRFTVPADMKRYMRRASVTVNAPRGLLEDCSMVAVCPVINE